MSTSNAPSVRRPFGIAVLEILGVINGVVSIAGGIFVLVGREDGDLLRQSDMTSTELLAVGVAAIVIGTFVLLLSVALGRGSEFARVLFAVFAVLNLGSGLYALVALHSEQRFAGAWTVALSSIVLMILFSHHAHEYYEKR